MDEWRNEINKWRKEWIMKEGMSERKDGWIKEWMKEMNEGMNKYEWRNE